MPSPPFAKLRASINGGAATSGGMTVPPSANVQLSADPSGVSGATAYKYEILAYPLGFIVPAGWSTDSAGVYFYSAGATPPLFTLPSISNWGKFMLRLTFNNGISPNPGVKPNADLVDEQTALSMLSPNGLPDLGVNEDSQFGNTWVTPVQANLRAVDTAITAVAGANAKPPAKLLGASNLAALSGEQTIDGVLTASSRVLLIAQTTSSQNGLWLTSAGSWTRPVDFTTDAQVVVGQTVFVTSGSLNAGTNWQLTSGNTIAGAKTYAQLVGGSAAPVLQPVDAIDATNNALSGTTAVDGVTLTANVSRVLVVNQTTSSQNGPWLVQSGAWTRPLDFAVDAQVVAGQSVYVKSGGTLGGGTTWQLTSGSTIAGAKTFAQQKSTGRAQVALVQTAALPAYTYNSGTKTITANANGALPTTIFDGVIPLVSDANRDVLIVREGTKNGIYTKTQDGDGSHPFIFVRRADLDSSSDFHDGVQIDVLNGATILGNNSGTRWGMTTLGTVTLDTTATTWAKLVSGGTIFYDLSKSPYFVKADAATDAGPAIKQFGLDVIASGLSTVGTKVVGMLPTGVVKSGTIWSLGKFTGLTCAYPDACILQRLQNNGGPLGVIGSTQPLTNYGGVIDTAAGAQPLYMYDTVTPTSGYSPWFDITYCAPLYFRIPSFGLEDLGWAQFEIIINLHVDLIPAAGPTSNNTHIMSIRGRRSNGDSLVDTALLMRCDTNGALQTLIRLKDTTTGVYGTVTYTGTGSTVVTGDGTIKPTNDRTVQMRFPIGGTIGAPGIKYQYSFDGISWVPDQPAALGSATSLTLLDPPAPDAGQHFAAKFNFAAGTIVAGDSLSCPCTGVYTAYTLQSPNGTIVNGGDYEITIQGSGATLSQWCSPLGGARGTPVTLSAHGLFYQKPWENFLLGNPQNFGFEESALDLLPLQFAFGAMRICDGNLSAPPSTTRTTIPNNATNQQFFFRPNTTPALDHFGNPLAWQSEQGHNSGHNGWMIPRRNPNGLAFPTNTSLSNIRFDGNVGTTSGVLILQTINSDYDNLNFNGGNDGLRVIGPSFQNHYGGQTFTCKRKSFIASNAGIQASGTWRMDGGMALAGIGGQSSITHEGDWFINTEDDTRICVWTDLLRSSSIANLIIDDENTLGSPRPSELLRLNIQGGNTLKVGGVIGGGIQTPVIRQIGTGNARLVVDAVVEGSGGPLLSVPAAGTPAIECGPSFFMVGSTQLVDLAGKARLYDGAYPTGANIAAGTPQTLNYSDGNRIVPTATLVGNTIINLADNLETESRVWVFDVDVQGFTLTFVDARSGNTIRVLPVGFSGLVKFVKNNVFNWARCAA